MEEATEGAASSEALLQDTTEVQHRGSEKKRTFTSICGNLVEHLEGGWQYAMAFTRLKEEDNKIVKDGDGMLSKIFTSSLTDEWQDKDPELWKRLREEKVMASEFRDIVFEKCKEVLTGERCGFDLGWQVSVDDDEVFLLIRLKNEDTLKRLAANMELMVPISFAAYDFEGLECRRIEATWGQKLGLNKELPPPAPLHLCYKSHHATSFRASRDEMLKEIDNAVAACLRGEPQQVRALARQSRKRIPTMTILTARMKEAEWKGPKAEFERLQQIFGLINEDIERGSVEDGPRRIATTNRILAIQDPKQKYHARVVRWSPPIVPEIEELRNAELYAKFAELDVLRVVYTSMKGFIDVDKMQEFGILGGFFAMHEEENLRKFSEQWASIKPQNLVQWPGTQWDEHIRNYFGEQVAFFFAWLGMLTRKLIVPSLLAAVFRFRKVLVSEDWRVSFEALYGLIMTTWCALFISTWQNESQTKCMLWGMIGFKSRARELPDYRPDLRGTVREAGVRLFHWVVVSAFVFQTIVVAGKMSEYRSYLHDQIQERMEHLQKEGLASAEDLGWEEWNDKAATYAITINIKIVAFLWKVITPRIARFENWRTFQERSEEQIFKNFLVMCVVYYYPFIYLAFFKPWVEKVSSKECMDELSTNLMTFFMIHIATVIAMMILSLAMKWWAQRSERKKTETDGKETTFTYVEDMNKREAYAGDEEDYLELMISLGFITMFAVVLPGVAVIALITGMLELRIQAWRLVHIRQRPVPTGQEGIGPWEKLLPFICQISATVSVALVIFALEPLHKNWGWPMWKKLAYFIFAERIMHAFLGLVRTMVPEETSKDRDILNQMTEVYNRLMMNQVSKDVPTGRMEPLQAKEKLVTPGKVLPTAGAAASLRKVAPTEAAAGDSASYHQIK